jgi:tricorn protease
MHPQKIAPARRAFAGFSSALVLLTALCFGTAASAASGVAVDAAMLRTPDVSADKIVFRYDNDVWLAPKGGGMAYPLSSPSGAEQFPRFSPDGSKVAFGASYDGNIDIYELPVSGGLPKRLSFMPGGAFMVDYAPDGRVVFGNGSEHAYRENRLYYASPTAGLPEKLPPFEAMFASFSANGEWVALDPQWIEYQNWNRYQGGTASNIWLYNLKNGDSRQMTDWPGTDTAPMFHGNDKVYFLSDAGPEHRRNIWVYDLASGQRRQVTTFKDYETKWPAIGPSDIVMENGGRLWLLDLATEKLSAVDIQVPGDRLRVMPQTIDAGETLMEAGVSPQGKRICVHARGDIWTIPVAKGFSRNLTRTNGVTERDPAWSPDGKWIAYFGNASGEYELYTAPGDGGGEAKRLTNDGSCFRSNPRWSPDSKKICFSDKTGALYIHIVESGETIKVDKDPWGSIGLSGTWAKDSNWLAYNLGDEMTGNNVVKLYDLANRSAHQVSSAAFDCNSPAFDLSGEFLFYASNRSIETQYGPLSDWGEFHFTDTTVLTVTTLRKDVMSPFAPKNDEEEVKTDEKPAEGAEPADGEKAADGAAPPAEDAKAAETPPADGAAPAAEGEKKEEEKVEPLKIDLEAIELRNITLPVAPGAYGNLAGGDKKLFYVKYPTDSNSPPTIMMYEFGDEPKETPLVPGGFGFDLTPDASKMLVAANGAFFVIPTAPGVPLDKPINTSGLLVEVDPREEWRQIVRDAWSRYRDYFYDPGMHGVDWDAAGERAQALVAHATNRGDVDFIIRQMIAELNAGHTYVFADPGDHPKQVPLGFLGCDFEYASDSEGNRGVRIKRVYRGADWDPVGRGPLDQPGVNVSQGEFLLAVNGIPLTADGNPHELLNATAGKATMLTVNSLAKLDGKERKVLVTPAGDDGELRLRAWIEDNRRYVYEKTGGKIGYIYVRDTANSGAADFMRQFIGQHNMQGLIIDERWNGGGYSPEKMVDILDRKAQQYWATRDGLNWRSPWYMNGGPKVMLINEDAGSGGDSFPWIFRNYGMGKLIGKRTWGGLIGISGNPPLLDGSGVSVPSFGFFESNGTWAVEGYGVDPDIEVANTPTVLGRNEDAQLDAGIATILDELQRNPWIEPQKPAYPDRSGAGIRPEDK